MACTSAATSEVSRRSRPCLSMSIRRMDCACKEVRSPMLPGLLMLLL